MQILVAQTCVTSCVYNFLSRLDRSFRFSAKYVFYVSVQHSRFIVEYVCLLCFITKFIFECEICCVVGDWYARVPSDSNVADDPSRMVHLDQNVFPGAACVVPVLPTGITASRILE